MEAFVRVVDAGSFSDAARHWGRSKAVVSKYVNALEAHLGVQLLRRTTRSLSLTEAGRAYRERCTDVLGEIQSLEASVRESAAAPRGPATPPGHAISGPGDPQLRTPRHDGTRTASRGARARGTHGARGRLL